MDELWKIKGGAFGFAFTAAMCSGNPKISEEVKKVYEWAEGAFLKLAKGEITQEEAILGYGG